MSKPPCGTLDLYIPNLHLYMDVPSGEKLKSNYFCFLCARKVHSPLSRIHVYISYNLCPCVAHMYIGDVAGLPRYMYCCQSGALIYFFGILGTCTS